MHDTTDPVIGSIKAVGQAYAKCLMNGVTYSAKIMEAGFRCQVSLAALVTEEHDGSCLRRAMDVARGHLREMSEIMQLETRKMQSCLLELDEAICTLDPAGSEEDIPAKRRARIKP